MSRTLSHEEVQDLLGAYAVHAVDDLDAAAIEAHIHTCDTCTEELGRLLEAAAAFGMNDIEEPSAEIWGRIQQGIRGETFAPAASTESEPPVGAPVISLSDVRERKRAGIAQWKIAVFSAAAAVTLAVPATLALTGGSPAPSLAAVAERAAGESGSRTVALVDPTGVRLADAVISPEGRGFIRKSALPPLANDKTYQLWVIENGQPVSLGILGRAPDVSTFTIAADADAIAISVEPATGSVAPSTTPVAVATLA